MRSDWRWLALVPFLMILCTLGILINNNIGNVSVDQSESTEITEHDLDIDWNKYETKEIELSDSFSIANSGTYILRGNLDGQITIKAREKNIKLVLDGATIKNAEGPAIACYYADNIVVELRGENTIEGEGLKDETSDIDGALFTNSNLIFTGDGTLNITSNGNDAVVSKKDIIFRSGKYHIVSKDDGIKARDNILIKNGTFSLETVADALKATNEQENGVIEIENGYLKINSGDDAIHAKNQLIINGGIIDIERAYEGLEAVKVIINNGEVSINSTDDGINAGLGTSESNTPRPGGQVNADPRCILEINGGDVYINSAGDGIDSNGYVNINGGKLVIDGPARTNNNAIDAGLDINIKGGEVFAIGNSRTEKANIKYELEGRMLAGTKIEIKDSKGKTIIEHQTKKQFSNFIINTPRLNEGEEYTVYINGQKQGTFIAIML